MRTEDDICFDVMIPVNYCRHNAKVAGVFAAILYSELTDHVSRRSYDSKKNKEAWDGWFSLSVENIYDRTGLTQEQQSEGIKMLKKIDAIDVKSIGLPAVRHFNLKHLNKHS